MPARGGRSPAWARGPPPSRTPRRAGTPAARSTCARSGWAAAPRDGPGRPGAGWRSGPAGPASSRRAPHGGPASAAPPRRSDARPAAGGRPWRERPFHYFTSRNSSLRRMKASMSTTRAAIPRSLDLLPIDDLPLAPAVLRRRLEGGPAAQRTETEPLEEAAARLVGLVDHGPHAGEPAAARLVEEPLHQAPAHGAAARLGQQVHVQMAGKVLFVQSLRPPRLGQKAREVREQAPEAPPPEQPAAQRARHGAGDHPPGLDALEPPPFEAARQIADHAPPPLGHPDAAGREIGIGANHQVHEEMGIDQRLLRVAVGGRAADLPHRLAVPRLVTADLDGGVVHAGRDSSLGFSSERPPLLSSSGYPSGFFLSRA